MAPNHRHGKDTVVLWNTVNLSTTLNDSSVDATVDTAEVTCYGHDDKVYIPGQRDATASFSGFVDGSTAQVDENVATALGGSTMNVITWGPLGQVVGRPAILAKAVATAHNITGTISDAAGVAISAQISGGPEGRQSGKWLTSTSPSTAVASGASVLDRTISTAAGGSTFGAVAHLHITSATTSTGAVAVQDSSDGSGWADLITFTFSSGASVQRSTVAGEVKEYVRANVTALSTAGATLGLAVARNRAST